MNALPANDANDQQFIGPVLVNGRRIARERIYAEMQHHPAPSPREAMYAAARSLVLADLLRESACEQGLCDREIDTASAAFDDVVEQLFEREVPQLKPTLQQRLEYFYTHREKFTSQPLAEVRHILLAVMPGKKGSSGGQKRIANKLLAEILRAADPLQHFTKLAQQRSNCSSGSAGGSLGQIGPGDTVAPFEQAVFSGGTGLVRTPVRTKYGWHLIYVERLERGRPLRFSHMEERIGKYLQADLRRRMVNVYLKCLVGKAEIQGVDMSCALGGSRS
ncbi:peptidylprolyl isomerase [uncultured Microbulbifer sp.]|uniref:peptidylprolyl isomerase n=1 Tax=uncultured Microbulbifer sp. TaxID=348147 RepID=UPI0025CFBAD3|nr:peptidylprolyl isomerase [uncultured Microbulbifer sp.]